MPRVGKRFVLIFQIETQSAAEKPGFKKPILGKWLFHVHHADHAGGGVAGK